MWKCGENHENVQNTNDSSIQGVQLDTRLTRVVADSGAGSTNETFRNSELIFAIFKNFALKFSELTSIKVLENKA